MKYLWMIISPVKKFSNNEFLIIKKFYKAFNDTLEYFKIKNKK